MATLNKREKIRERARKHTRNVWECPICKKSCRGNGGRASHQRMHVLRAGYTERDIEVLGLRVIFNSLWMQNGGAVRVPPPDKKSGHE